MVDKKLEANIKKTKDFLELWNKFHSIFKNVCSSNPVDTEEVKRFLSTKALVNSRYEDLMDSLSVKALKRFIISPSVYSVFSLENLSIMSDDRIKLIEKDWKDSFTFLAALLNRLEKKKVRIEKFNKFYFLVKKTKNKILHRN